MGRRSGYVVIEYTILISNLLVTIGLFLVTAYRVKIEKKQINILIKNANAAEKIKMLKQTIKKEKDEILKMNSEEVLELLEEVCNNED